MLITTMNTNGKCYSKCLWKYFDIRAIIKLEEQNIAQTMIVTISYHNSQLLWPITKHSFQWTVKRESGAKVAVKYVEQVQSLIWAYVCRLVLLLTGPTYALRVHCNDHLYGRIKHSLKKDNLDLCSENHSSTRTIQNGILGRLHNPSPKSFGRHFKQQIFSYTQGFSKLHRYILK